MVEKYQNPLLNIREITHGSFFNTALIAQNLKDYVREYPNNRSVVQMEALDMICTKIARICSGDPNEPDHWKDIAGYAQLVISSLPEPLNVAATSQLAQGQNPDSPRD